MSLFSDVGDRYIKRILKENDIALMKRLAKKYGYKVTK
jgi:hypothetical protein